jgi:hypothetical protein
MATIDPFEAALKEARKALQEAFEQKNEIENRIVSLKQTIEGLSALVEPEVGELVELRRPGLLTVETSLTDAIRKVFANSSEYTLTPPDVRDALLAMGLDLEKYKQPLVPIHNTLKRLERQEEIVAFKDDKGVIRGYCWVSPLARAVAEVDSGQRMVSLREFRGLSQEQAAGAAKAIKVIKGLKRLQEESRRQAFDSHMEKK